MTAAWRIALGDNRRFGRGAGAIIPISCSTEIENTMDSLASINTETRQSPSSYPNTVCCEIPIARASSAWVIRCSFRS
jgi:hypothetical protein